jgi:hypothetical protein
MTIRAVRVTVACDRCGRVFSVALDEAMQGLIDWAVYDYAHDAVRGSLEYRDESGSEGHVVLGCSSVQGEDELCATCTLAEDTEEVTT